MPFGMDSAAQRPHSRLAIVVGALLAFVAFMGTGGLTKRNLQRIAEHEAWVTHTQEVRAIESQCLEALVSAESSARGYLLRASPPLLAVYQTALTAVPACVRRSIELTQDNPPQQVRMVAQGRLIAERMALLAQLLQLAQRSGVEAARSSPLIDSGADQMTQIKAHADAIIQAEDQLLAQRREQSHASMRIATRSNLLATLSGSVAIALALWLFWRDAKGRQRATEALHQQREWLRTTLASIADGVLVIDAAGRVRYLNDTARRLSGRGDADLGRRVDEVLPLFDENTGAPLPSPALQAVEQRGAVELQRFATLNPAAGGVLPIEDSAAPIRNSLGQVVGAVMVFRDVRARREWERQLQSAKEAAEEANRAKSLFLANMSHELRTPLNAIIGYSEMLIEDVDVRQPAMLGADLRRISSAGKHLLALINHVLDLSKIEAGRMDLYLESVAAQPLLKDIIETARPLAERNGNALRLEVTSDLGEIYSDVTKLRQSLLNLLSNACKFTERGQVVLRASRSSGPQGERLVLQVSDTGIGLTPEQIGRLFTPFSQGDPLTARKFGGTGLGLAITRSFVELMGGALTLESEPGQGTVFTIQIPVRVAQPEPPPVEPLPAGSGRPVVLVIDDDDATRDLTRRILTQDGFEVQASASGKEALQRLRALRPVAIVLDVIMPEMDGWAVLSALKSDPDLRDIPVIMMSILDEKNLAFSLGAAEYLLKPVDRGRLTALLTQFRCERPPCPVLIVEDDDITRARLRSMLEQEGWIVREAANGMEAIARIQEERPELIITDLLMPVMDGFELAAALHAKPAWRAIPVVILTAKDLTAEDRRRLNGHVEKVLLKDAQNLSHVLDEVRGRLRSRLAAEDSR